MNLKSIKNKEYGKKFTFTSIYFNLYELKSLLKIIISIEVIKKFY